MTPARASAQEARRITEAVLDAAGWPWAPQVSRWIDLLVEIEESQR